VSERDGLPHYNMDLRASQAQNAVDAVWQVAAAFRDLGRDFVLCALGSPSIERTALQLDSRDSVAAILQDTTLRYTGAPELGMSFVLWPEPPAVRVYFSVGNMDLDSDNTLRVHYSTRRPLLELVPGATLRRMFIGCVQGFTPYWGCIKNLDNVDRLNGQQFRNRRGKWPRERGPKVDERLVPKHVHWFNYFGPEFVERLGGASFLLDGPVAEASSVPEVGGVVWILQDEPFDDNNAEHLARQQRAAEYLRLADVHKRYPLKRSR